MDEEEFLETVRQEVSLDSKEGVMTITDATVRTLGERITDGEASDLAQNLPEQLEETLTDVNPGEADPFSLEEFIERVSDRAEVDESDVVVHSRAVATALAVAVKTELEIVREQLPSEFDVIFEPGGPITDDKGAIVDLSSGEFPTETRQPDLWLLFRACDLLHSIAQREPEIAGAQNGGDR